MRVLFDEGVPKDLRRSLIGHECSSVIRLGWQSVKNGTLLTQAERAGFQVLVTFDGNMEAEQNMRNRKIALLVLRPRAQGNAALRELAGMALIALAEIAPGEIRVVRHDDPE